MKIKLSKSQWQTIGNKTGWLKTAQNTGLALDGMNNIQARKTVNNIIAPLTKGLFSDQAWEPVNAIFKTLTNNNINWVLKSANYTHGNDGKSDGKIWKFEIYFSNNKGCFKTLYGIVRAAWAGSVQDPSDKYDLVAYVT